MKRIAPLLAILVALGAPSPASAQSRKKSSSPAKAAEAEASVDKATAAFALGQFAEAAAQYENAFRLQPEAALLYNAAQSHRLAGNKERALELYKNYVRVYLRGTHRAEAARHIETLEKELAEPPPAKTAMSPPSLGPPPLAQAAPPPSTPASHPAEGALTATAPPPDRPLTKKPWFWIAVGGAVLLAAGGVALAASGGSSAPPPPSLGHVTGN
jgi:hypothetical protein